MEQHKYFSTSVKLWFHSFIDMVVGLVIAFTILLIAMNVLNVETVTYYDTYVKLAIVLFGYIGLLIGTHKTFMKFFKEKIYFSRKIKYLVALYQAILFVGFAGFCYMNKVNVIFFIGGYVSIFIQFIFNFIYTTINNFRFPKGKSNSKSRLKTSKQDKNTNSDKKIFDFDIEKLK